MIQGCKKCSGCLNSPIRGNYDGMVILSVITKDILPFASVPTYDITNVNLRNKDQYMDHERFAVYLETALTSHFMFKEKELALKCVSTSKVAYAMEEAISAKSSIDPTMLGLLGANKDSEKTKKFPGYVIYVGYRLRRRVAPSTQVAEHANFKLGKHLSFIASVKQLQNLQIPTKNVQNSVRQIGKTNQEIQEKVTKDKINQEIHEQDSAETSQERDSNEEFDTWQRRFSKDVEPGKGTGEYEIEDLEDDEYGTVQKVIKVDNNKPVEYDGDDEDNDDDDEGIIPSHEDDEVDDEKMLEELENKQLMFKLGTLDDDYKTLRHRINELQTGEVTIDNRLLTLEDSVKQLKD